MSVQDSVQVNKNTGKGWGSKKRKEREEELLRDTKHFGASPVLIQTLSKIRAGAFSRANSKPRSSVNQRNFTEHRKICSSMSKTILALEDRCGGTDEAHIREDQLRVTPSLLCCVIRRQVKSILDETNLNADHQFSGEFLFQNFFFGTGETVLPTSVVQIRQQKTR